MLLSTRTLPSPFAKTEIKALTPSQFSMFSVFSGFHFSSLLWSPKNARTEPNEEAGAAMEHSKVQGPAADEIGALLAHKYAPSPSAAT